MIFSRVCAIQRLYHTDDIFLEILCLLNFREIVILAHIDRGGRIRVQDLLHRRINHQLSRFLSNTSHEVFINLLRITGAAVAGSIGHAIINPDVFLAVAGFLPPWQLNITTPPNTLGAWSSFFKMSGYEELRVPRWRHKVIRQSSMVDSYKVLSKNRVRITLIDYFLFFIIFVGFEGFYYPKRFKFYFPAHPQIETHVKYDGDNILKNILFVSEFNYF